MAFMSQTFQARPQLNYYNLVSDCIWFHIFGSENMVTTDLGQITQGEIPPSNPNKLHLSN